MKVSNFFKFDTNFSISMDSDKFYLRYQNVIFGWIHLVLGILGSVYAGYRAFVDLLKAKSASDLDSTYLRYVMLREYLIKVQVCLYENSKLKDSKMWKNRYLNLFYAIQRKNCTQKISLKSFF